jgi:hypothetical protein
MSAGEPLSEPGLDGRGLVIRGVHNVLIAPQAAAAARLRRAMHEATLHPLYAFGNLATSPGNWIAAHRANYTGLRTPLPANLMLLTTQIVAPRTLLLRLAHLFEVRAVPRRVFACNEAVGQLIIKELFVLDCRRMRTRRCPCPSRWTWPRCLPTSASPRRWSTR